MSEITNTGIKHCKIATKSTAKASRLLVAKAEVMLGDGKVANNLSVETITAQLIGKLCRSYL